MALHLHRSNRTEALVDALCGVLSQTRPRDPFALVPIVVGSRGMERWLRHEIATRQGIAAGLAFPFPRQAFSGAAAWLLDPKRDPEGPFWKPGDPDASRAWERDPFTFRVVEALRARRDDPRFAQVASYLGEGHDEAISARELLFAGEVADALDGVMHDRPEEAATWTEDPTKADEHAWLAALLGDLEAIDDEGSPLHRHRRLMASRPIATGRHLCVFGLSTVGPGDRMRLAAIARSIDVHLFVLTPTSAWIGDTRTPGEQRAARRKAPDEAARDALEAELALDNPVLASLAAPSRDLQQWLERVGYEGDTLEPVEPASASLLHRFQGWVLEGRAADPWDEAPDDASIRVHSCYGALRQCEALRDDLLARFAADPTLEPRDVLVMTPDIQTFAPLVAAVFARDEKGGAPSIPVSIADLGLRRTNPIAEVLLHVLELAGERLTAPRVVDFLQLQPVRERARLSDEDAMRIRDWVRESGLRWGDDANDRAAVGQPAGDRNTVRFAVERLALGALMADEGPLEVIDDPSGGFGPSVPVELRRRDDVERFGRFATLLRTLSAHRRALREPALLSEWRTRLSAALDELSATSDTTAWMRAEVDAELDQLAHLPCERPVDRTALWRWLGGRFELGQKGDRAITGAVQVCAMEPMRSVPFRVVALLGMDAACFPRGGQKRVWDPLERRKRGEHDRRDIDRHLLLEAILCARDELIVTWSGRDVAQGEAQPAAVPVEELLDVLAKLTSRPREQFVREHPLQPWSASCFGEAATSFDRSLAQAAERLRGIQRGHADPEPAGLALASGAALPGEAAVPDEIPLDRLVRGLLKPHTLLLKDRLGLSVDYGEEAIEEREPLEFGGLAKWQLRDRILAQHEGGGATGLALLDARLAGDGKLPASAAGTRLTQQTIDEMDAVMKNMARVGGEQHEPVPLRVAIDERVLVGQLRRVVVRDDGWVVQFSVPRKSPKPGQRMSAWVHLLAGIACGLPLLGAHVVGFEQKAGLAGDVLVFDGDARAARGALADLVALWRAAHHRPVPLFSRISEAIVKTLAKFPDDDEARRTELAGRVAEEWEGTPPFTFGDRHDPWVAAFFVDYDPVEHLDERGPWGLVPLAERVWSPLDAAVKRGASLKKAWGKP